MTTFFANPFSYDLTGFYFSDLESYKTRLTSAKKSSGNIDFEHDIEFINGSDIECKIFKSVGENVEKFFEVIDQVEDLTENQISLVCYLVENEFSSDFESAISVIEDYEIYDSESEFHEALTEQVCGGLESDSPLVRYFDAESYARDCILNSEYFELDNNVFATDPNTFCR